MRLIDSLEPVLREATSRHHLIRTSDFARAEIGPSQIRWLCRAGMIERVARGLYRVAGTRSSTQDIAAALSRHAVAAASHTSALYLHGIDVRPPNRPHVTLPRQATSKTSLGLLHRSRLPEDQLVMVDGIRVVSLPRAVVDAADVFGSRQLGALLDEVTGRRLVTVNAIARAMAVVEDAPGRGGLGALRVLLEVWHESIRPDSPAEAAAIRRIVDFGLPVPETQFEVRDRSGAFVARVDMAWPMRRVIREYDSDRFHGVRSVDRDEGRRQRIEAAGWKVGVISRRDLAPSQFAWLGQLARDLGVDRQIAS